MIFLQEIVDSIGADLESQTENPVYLNYVPQGFKRPSYSVVAAPITMDVSTTSTVTMVATVEITAHCTVDVHHNQQFADLSKAMAGIFGLFATQSYPVEDRYLTVAACKGEGGLDFATVTVTFVWEEDMAAFDHADVPTFDMMGDLDLTITE